jgi:hypothetical protein
MKNTIFCLLICLSMVIGTVAQGQIFDPVKWSFAVEDRTATEAKLVFTAKIDQGWHLYSQYLAGDGPVPTSFTFKELGGASLNGTVSEGKGKVEMDPNFDLELKYFEGKARFIQKVKLSDKATVVKGELEFMVCDDKRCLPPDVKEFEFSVATFEKAVIASENQETSGSAGQEMSVSGADASVAGILDPIKWTFTSAAGKDGDVELRFTAKLDKGWHLYGLDLPKDGIPIPTVFSFTGNDIEKSGRDDRPRIHQGTRCYLGHRPELL